MLAKMINELSSNETPIIDTGKRSWDNSGKRFGSTEKSKHELGFEAKTEIRDGLEKTIAWTKANINFIDRCIDKHRDKL